MQPAYPAYTIAASIMRPDSLVRLWRYINPSLTFLLTCTLLPSHAFLSSSFQLCHQCHPNSVEEDKNVDCVPFFPVCSIRSFVVGFIYNRISGRKYTVYNEKNKKKTRKK